MAIRNAAHEDIIVLAVVPSLGLGDLLPSWQTGSAPYGADGSASSEPAQGLSPDFSLCLLIAGDSPFQGQSKAGPSGPGFLLDNINQYDLINRPSAYQPTLPLRLFLP